MDKLSRPLVTLDSNPIISYFKVEDQDPRRTSKEDKDGRAMQEIVALQRTGAIRLHVGKSTEFEYYHAHGQDRTDEFRRRLEAIGLDREDIFTSPLTISFGRPDTPGVTHFGLNPDTGMMYEMEFNLLVHFVLFQGRKEKEARNPPFRWHDFRNQECDRRGIAGVEREALIELDAQKYLYIPPSRLAPQTRPTPNLDTLSPERQEALSNELRDMDKRWWNVSCDAQGLYNHISYALQTAVPEHAVFVTSDKNFTGYSAALKMSKLEYLKTRGFPGHILNPAAAVEYLKGVAGVTVSEGAEAAMG